MPTAVYAGSFDPVTNGHVDIVRRAASLFGAVVVAVGRNPGKRYWFDAEQRVSLFEEALADVPGVTVIAFDGLLVDLCQHHAPSVIVRGVRSTSDVDLELRYAMANRDLSGVDSVFLAADPQHVFLSSSIVKEIHGSGGDASKYVPSGVAAALKARTP